MKKGIKNVTVLVLSLMTAHVAHAGHYVQTHEANIRSFASNAQQNLLIQNRAHLAKSLQEASDLIDLTIKLNAQHHDLAQALDVLCAELNKLYTGQDDFDTVDAARLQEIVTAYQKTLAAVLKAHPDLETTGPVQRAHQIIECLSQVYQQSESLAPAPFPKRAEYLIHRNQGAAVGLATLALATACVTAKVLLSSGSNSSDRGTTRDNKKDGKPNAQAIATIMTEVDTQRGDLKDIMPRLERREEKAGTDGQKLLFRLRALDAALTQNKEKDDLEAVQAMRDEWRAFKKEAIEWDGATEKGADGTYSDCDEDEMKLKTLADKSVSLARSAELKLVNAVRAAEQVETIDFDFAAVTYEKLLEDGEQENAISYASVAEAIETVETENARIKKEYDAKIAQIEATGKLDGIEPRYLPNQGAPGSESIDPESVQAFVPVLVYMQQIDKTIVKARLNLDGLKEADSEWLSKNDVARRLKIVADSPVADDPGPEVTITQEQKDLAPKTEDIPDPVTAWTKVRLILRAKQQVQLLGHQAAAAVMLERISDGFDAVTFLPGDDEGAYGKASVQKLLAAVAGYDQDTNAIVQQLKTLTKTATHKREAQQEARVADELRQERVSLAAEQERDQLHKRALTLREQIVAELTLLEGGRGDGIDVVMVAADKTEYDVAGLKELMKRLEMVKETVQGRLAEQDAQREQVAVQDTDSISAQQLVEQQRVAQEKTAEMQGVSNQLLQAMGDHFTLPKTLNDKRVRFKEPTQVIDEEHFTASVARYDADLQELRGLIEPTRLRFQAHQAYNRTAMSLENKKERQAIMRTYNNATDLGEDELLKLIGKGTQVRLLTEAETAWLQAIVQYWADRDAKIINKDGTPKKKTVGGSTQHR